jgi:response regulator of citrate/malate metabolism
MRTIHNVTQRVRAEYLEMPGMRLKAEQVQRLCGIERTMCQQVLDSLVESKFLCVKPDGHYARSTEGYSSRPQSAKADLRTDTCAKKAS